MPVEVLVLGSNGSGQLGIGHLVDVSTPTKCLIPHRAMSRPKAVAAGGNHTLIFYWDGSVYATGDNRDGRCCSDQASEVLLEPVHVSLLDHRERITNFFACSATWEASILVTLDNRVFTCGSGSKGELGHGPGITNARFLKGLEGFPPPGTTLVDLSACVSHVIAVLSNGDVYGWGSGRKGQLGEPRCVVWSPRKIQGLKFKAMRAVCGQDFTFIVGSSQEGDYIVLGSDKWSVISSAPASVVKWKAIAASWGSIFVISSDGLLYGWGRNDHGQLPPEHLEPMQSIEAGSEHAIAESASGEIIAWGWGEHGNCGKPFLRDGDLKKSYNVVCHGNSYHTLGAGCATTWIIRDI